MGWRDNYRAASFRGVAFFVESADSTHGRRQAVHEHAQRDVPYTEDLGRKAREFSVSGYLIGVDYQTNRDELIKACETAGPGALVHPYRGEMTVVCRGLGLSESTSEGGMCVVKLTFLEAGGASFPSAKVDSVNAISTKGNIVTARAGEGCLTGFKTAGFPNFVTDSAAAGISALGEALSVPGFGFLGDPKAASDFIYQAKSFVADAKNLARDPSQMVGRVIGLLSSVNSAFGINAFKMLIDLFDSSTSSFTGSTATPSRQQQAANFGALNALVRQVALAQATKAAVVTQVPVTTFSGATQISTVPTVYDSYQAAIKVRETLVDRLDAESEATPSDEMYVALSDLRTGVVQAVPDPEQDLARIVQYVPRETLPSLLVAYQIYGDAGRANEIALRNGPRHPGFLIGGNRLEVLADG